LQGGDHQDDSALIIKRGDRNEGGRSPSDPKEGAILALELGLGWRRVEVMRQKVSDIDNRTITVLGKGNNGGKLRTLMLNNTVSGLVVKWMEERDLIVQRFQKEHPNGAISDNLFIHEQEGELRGYSESGVDRIVRTFRGRMEKEYSRTFDFSNHTMSDLWKTSMEAQNTHRNNFRDARP
jgi:integrase